MNAELTWAEVRNQFPERWVLIEAMAATSVRLKRVVERMVVVGDFSDSAEAVNVYVGLHRADHSRELYFAHTSNDTLEISERTWLGVRAA